MTPIFAAFFILCALTCPLRAVDVQCQSNSECGPGHCCTLGPVRYSLPQCKPMQEEGDICRPGSTAAFNSTVGYPDGTELTLTNVHYIFCPCSNGLSCDAREGVCKKTSDSRELNLLSGENGKQDD